MATSITSQSHPLGSMSNVALLSYRAKSTRQPHFRSTLCRISRHPDKRLRAFSFFGPAKPGSDPPLTRRDTHEPSKIVERDQPIRVDHVPDREHDRRDDGRPDELALEARDRRRAGIAAGRDRPLLLLAANTPG